MASSAPSAAPGSASLLIQVGRASLQGNGLEPDNLRHGVNRAPEARASQEGWVRDRQPLSWVLFCFLMSGFVGFPAGVLNLCLWDDGPEV